MAGGKWKSMQRVKMALLLGKGVEGVSDTVMEEVREYVMYWTGKWWQRRTDLLYGELINGFWSSPLPPLWTAQTQHMHYLVSYFPY